MARYFKLAPLVFLMCACLLLLVVGCSKPAAEQVKEGQALLVSDAPKALEHAQAAIDQLASQPASPERDKTLFDARVLKIEALGASSTAQAMAEYETLAKDSPTQLTSQVVWEIALALREGTGEGQGTAVTLLDAAKKRFPDSAAKFQSLIDSITNNPNESGKKALSSLGYLGGSKKEAPKKDAAKPDEAAKPKPDGPSQPKN
jgi:hypothetical protein